MASKHRIGQKVVCVLTEDIFPGEAGKEYTIKEVLYSEYSVCCYRMEEESNIKIWLETSIVREGWEYGF